MELIHGDCIAEMKKLKTNSIDFCLTDPPYGTTCCSWDSIIPKMSMWFQLKRVVKDDGAIALFGSEPFSSILRFSNIENFRYDWVWKKSNAANIASAKSMPMKYHELISVFCNKTREIYYPQKITRESPRMKQAHVSNYKFKQNYKDLNSKHKSSIVDCRKYDKDFKNPSSILEFNSVRPNSKEKVCHPTQKPVALLEYLIKTYTLENETVLDFTMGSGSTGVACKNLKRKFIGIEKSNKYFNIAKKRIAEA